MWKYTKNEKLYETLTAAIEDILTASREDGTISSYLPGKEFFGWDIWARKYVLLGMYYYMEICRDPELKKRVLNSALRQLNVIISRIGPESEGKIPITRTSNFWQGLNSSSILEPVMLYYDLTGEEKLLKFAKYIVDNGGIEGGNIFELARENRIDPYMYPVTKAYEMISCMEGLLEYALTTGDESLKRAVVDFAHRVLGSDYTVIGSGGTTHELFDHSSWRQSSMGVCEIAQETCVTVTMMKFFSRLFRETGDNTFADALEKSFYNAYLGALNTEKQVEPKLSEQSSGLVPEFLPFDSYSPLTAGRRGRKIGGFMVMPGGRYYGCCACIGSLGAAVMGLGSVRADGNVIFIDQYIPGSAEVKLKDGSTVGFRIVTNYPYEPEASIVIDRVRPVNGASGAGANGFGIRLRIPSWALSYEIVSGETAEGSLNEDQDGFVTFTKNFSEGDKLTIRFGTEIRVIRPVLFGTEKVGDQIIRQDPLSGERICVTYGPIVLSPEIKTTEDGLDVPVPAAFFTEKAIRGKEVSVSADPPESGSTDSRITVKLRTDDGDVLTLKDYASRGKNWNGPYFGAWFRIS